MKSIILLSGPVGAGKTTIARELIACSPGPITYIEGDTFWTHIAQSGETAQVGDAAAQDSEAASSRHRQFKMIMTAMVTAAVPYALYGYETILDFSIPPWFLETVDKVASRKEIPVDYVVVRPSLAICSARAAARPDGAIHNYAPYADLYADFEAIGRRHIVISEAQDAATVARAIREGLDEGNFRLH